jgi:demethylspheroidene O-methyltransferase
MSSGARGEPRILEILDGFIESKILMTAFQLDLFTAACEPIGRAGLVKRLGLPERSGGILIDACLAIGVLEEVDGGVRTPAALAPFLRKGDVEPFRATTYLIDYYAEVYKALVDMRELVATDGASSTFKLRDYFKEDVADVDPTVAAKYSHYMDATIQSIVEVVLESFSFADRRYLFDLCGGTGAFCAAIARAHPHLGAGFIDVPACVTLGGERLAADPALAARITGVAGDVFTAPLPRDADVFTLCRAAMDWGDDRILGLYRRVHEALPPGGCFLVVERMLPERFTPEAKPIYLRSIYFLAKSTSTRLRTPAQHQALLVAAGFPEAELVVPPRDPHRYLRGFRVMIARKR